MVSSPADRTLERLQDAPLEVIGRFGVASNATLLVRLVDQESEPLPEPVDLDDLAGHDLAVYKPRHGEAPLWDFPQGTLFQREVAAYEVSEALGWDLVPETVIRRDAPLGIGSLQRYVDHDPHQHYFWLLQHGDEEILSQLQAMVVFDLLIDNADRKGGHVLLEEGRIRLVDHGVSFNEHRKIRTVAWEFAGEPVPDHLRADVAALATAVDGHLGASLGGLLADAELAALRRRIDEVAATERFPEPQGPRPYPWPLL